MNLLSFLGPVADLGKTYLNNKAEKSKAKHEQQLQVIKNGAEWESKMADASASSWKDEFWTIILSLPLLAIFWGIVSDNPEIIDRVRHAFVVLSELDDWYTYLLFLAISASFGIRGADKLMKVRK